jgi:hypothetical protein
VPSVCESFNGDIIPLLIGQKNASGGFSHHFSMHSIALDKIRLCIIEIFFRIICNLILNIHKSVFDYIIQYSEADLQSGVSIMRVESCKIEHCDMVDEGISF